MLESFELFLGDRPIWSGEAVVVHENGDRIGCRFTSGVVDLQHLRLGATLESRLEVLRAAARSVCPPTGAPAVADLRQLLEDARDEIQDIERRPRATTRSARRDDEAELFEALRPRWGTAYYEAVTQLHAMSQGSRRASVPLGA